MKKYVSIFLSMFLLLSVPVIPAHAEENPDSGEAITDVQEGTSEPEEIPEESEDEPVTDPEESLDEETEVIETIDLESAEPAVSEPEISETETLKEEEPEEENDPVSGDPVSEEQNESDIHFGLSGSTAPVISESHESWPEGEAYSPSLETVIVEEEEPEELLEAKKVSSLEKQIQKEYDYAKRVLDSANKKVEKAQNDLDSAEYRKAAGIKGFFSWLSTNQEISKDARNDAKIAVMLLNNDPAAFKNSAFVGYHASGRPQSISDLLQNNTDVNDLSYLRQSVLYIQECNDLRASDEHFPGLKPLAVSTQLMAVSMLQLNWSANVIEHSKFFNVGENLAWGYSDPFIGWYTAEKKDYENGDYGSAGHYTNMCNNGYTASGFAMLRQNALYGVAYGQVFDPYWYDAKGLFSVSDYLNLVDDYCPKENAQEILAVAKEEQKTAELNFNIAKNRLDIIKGKKDGFITISGKDYWYEKAVRQGTTKDKKGVKGDGTIRGREVYDPITNAWYWLDSLYDGAKAVNKEVWMPYIFQDEKTMDAKKIEEWRQFANIYTEDPNFITAEMGNQLVEAIKNRTGKWVRYDQNGKMMKGWVKIEGDLANLYPHQTGFTYFYDYTTGLMAKGWTTIGGRQYHFDETTGVLLN